MKSQEKWSSLLRTVEEGKVPATEGIVCFSPGESGRSRLFLSVPWAGVYLFANQIADGRLPGEAGLNRQFITLNYCLSGRCEVGLQDGTYIYMEPGMLCLSDHEPKDGYAYPNGHYEGLEFAFDRELLRQGTPRELLCYGRFDLWIEELLAESGGKYLARVNDDCAERITAIFDALTEQTGDMESLRFHTLCLLRAIKEEGLSLLANASFVTGGQRFVVTQVESRVTADLSCRHSVTALAAEYGVSPSALKKYFAEVYGQPISRYLRQKRMELARTMLSGTRQSIGEIANACGYSNQGKFGSVFREETGMTPLEYRRMTYGKKGADQ